MWHLLFGVNSFFRFASKNRTSMLPFFALAALCCGGGRTIAKPGFGMQGAMPTIFLNNEYLLFSTAVAGINSNNSAMKKIFMLTAKQGR